MTRDETVALFEACEEKRAEARAAARDKGKSERDANETAHLAAREHWNAWAQGMLVQRQTLEAAGKWVIRLDWRGDVIPGNEASANWLDAAKANFFALRFPHAARKAQLSGFAYKARNSLARPTVIPGKGFAVRFDGFIFPGYAEFERAQFPAFASFRKTNFGLTARFDWALFESVVWFEEAHFLSFVRFFGTKFLGPARFDKAEFDGFAGFPQATFSGYSSFAESRFRGEANFNAIRVERELSMAGARFEGVPDFIQAHFEEAPRLDNIEVKGRMLTAREKEPEDGEKLSRRMRLHRELQDKSLLYRRATHGTSKDSYLRDEPARWRALKRLAIQGHDTDRELAFFSGEVRSARFAGDWPLPWSVWKASAWGGFFRFWFGLLYEFFSDFGRSVFRPLLAWVIAILAFAAFYLSQTDVMQRDLALQGASYFSAAAQAGRYAMSNTAPCYTRPPTFADRWRSNWGLWGTVTRPLPDQAIRGLGKELRSQTNARTEALHLAFRNSLIAIDAGGDASYRIYGCLYGLVGNTPIVPGSVSAASAIQKLISGVLIFLFGLALRNMLKVK